MALDSIRRPESDSASDSQAPSANPQSYPIQRDVISRDAGSAGDEAEELPPEYRPDRRTSSNPERRQMSETPGHQYYFTYLAAQAAVDQKGLDVRAIDVSNVTNIADIFVIVSGTSDRHVEGLADKIRAALGNHGEHPAGSSGYESSQWVILDYGNLVIHLFYEPTRQHYHFDELWEKGIVLTPPPSLEKEMRMLRTGMYR